jgi:cytochrome c oxidase cbb3-type subunit 4
MSIYSVLSSIMTVVSFVLFIGIVAWAYSKRRKAAFEAAANAPFALPDEHEERSQTTRNTAERRS